VKKGLIIQTRPGVGDACLFLPYIQEITLSFNNHHFTVITKKRSSAKDVYEMEKKISEIVYLEDLISEKKNKINHFFEILKFVKTNNFEIIFIFHFSLFWNLISKFSNIKSIYSYGFFKKNVDIYFNALECTKLWLKKNNVSSHCTIPYKTYEKKRQIILGIGSSGPTKKWPTDSYVSLIKKIENKNIEFYLASGNNLEETTIADQIINELKGFNIKKLSNSSIKEIMKFIKESLMYIGNDTGFMHLSAGLDIPSIGLFGDSPLSYANYSKNIYPIIPDGFKTVGHNSRAIQKISVDQVYLKYLELFKNSL